MSDACSTHTTLHDVALDVQAEDVPGVGAHLVGVLGELDAAGLAAPADLHLRLDDDGIPDAVGGGDRVVDGLDGLAGRHGDAVARANSCLPWYSNRSTGAPGAGGVRRGKLLLGLALARVERRFEPVGDRRRAASRA